MICHRDCFETFWYDGTQYVDNSNIGQFPQKSCFSANEQFEPNLGQNYATLYRRQLSLMICSLGFLKCCCVIQYLD